MNKRISQAEHRASSERVFGPRGLLLAPLYGLRKASKTSKPVGPNWGAAEEEEFTTWKEELVPGALLIFLDFSRPFILSTHLKTP